MTSIMAPAHPHATRVAVYPALFLTKVDMRNGTLYSSRLVGKRNRWKMMHSPCHDERERERTRERERERQRERQRERDRDRDRD